MSSMQRPLIYNAGRLAAADTDSVGNIIDSAQLGIGPNLPNIDGATPLVLSPIVPIVTHTPTMFANVPYANEVLKALVERHAKDVQGIDFGYQMEGAETPVGHDGQSLHMPTNARRTPVTPSFTWQEVSGNLIWNFFRQWLEMIKHPDTQASVLAALDQNGGLDPMLLSFFSMDVLFIQYDSTMRPENIIDAYFVTSMWPQETGMLGAKRTIGHSEIIDRTIQFYGIVQHNRNTKIIGQRVADALGLHRVNYDFATPVAESINDDITSMGLEREAVDSLANFI